MVETSTPPSLDQVESLASQYVREACDGLLVIGSSEVQTLARLLRIRLSLSIEDFARIWESEVIEENVRSSIPLACLPYGDSDGNESQIHVWCGQKRFNHPDLLPDLIGIDPRITMFSTPREIAANACTTLLNLITTFNDTGHMIMDSYLASGFEFLQNALHNWVFTTHSSSSWKDISSDVVAAQCLAGICAYNRGNSSIVQFVETLAVDGFADRHQSAAALLPVLMEGIQQDSPQQYTRLREFLRQDDPKRLVEDWITLFNPQGLDHIIQELCICTYRLFENVGVLREVKPMLTLLANGVQEPSAAPSSKKTRRRNP
jgi:alcohol dehydrogenase class IV